MTVVIAWKSETAPFKLAASLTRIEMALVVGLNLAEHFPVPS